MAFSEIAYEVTDHVATVTLKRPERLNAFTFTMRGELIEAFDLADADDDVRAVVVTGAGRAFCAGADLGGGGGTFARRDQTSDGETSKGETSDGETVDGVPRDGGGTVALRIARSLKPVIGAINGPAVGVGVTMTLPMDVRLASETARFGFVFARRGIVTEAASSWFLPRIVGIAQAMEWAATGRVFPAAEALEGRLVSRVYPADELLPAAYALAREIADNTSAVSVAAVRRLMWSGLSAASPWEAHAADSRLMAELGGAPDSVEGVTAFMEKRPAAFPMKVSQDLPPGVPSWPDDPYRV
ncbi:enoyl-CoA hydratase-related protein [Nonomuraea fuscirosea]|uniref:enoyl-CoA hydratase-related protein n=1 Tax=Nonomuraea fuscirosea TaxID=1291556 RepID=UPI002DDB61C4|nr:enoyl-CoA hydratase-related protein [Nonomuraea fuscirosea]WSA54708.1 enoyl-CoA hydratase-related protein [Nonomuraea fuscirosea]